MSEIDLTEVTCEIKETCCITIEELEAYRQFLLGELKDFLVVFAVTSGVVYLLSLVIPQWLLIVFGIALVFYMYHREHQTEAPPKAD